MPKSFVPIGSGIQQFISSGPILCLAYTRSFSCAISGLLPVCPFFLQDHDLPDDAFSIFHFFRQEFWSITSTWHFHVLASSSAPHASIPVRFRAPLCSMFHSFTPLVDKTPLFFRLWLEVFSPSIVLLGSQNWLRTAELHTLLLSCCTVFALASAINPSSNIAPAFANSSGFSLQSATTPLKLCHLFFFFLRTVCLHMCHFHQDAFFTSSCNASQILIHRSASPAPGLIHSSHLSVAHQLFQHSSSLRDSGRCVLSRALSITYYILCSHEILPTARQRKN